MPKNVQHQDHSYLTSQKSRKSYTRQPIHARAENREETIDDEEEENYLNLKKEEENFKQKNLYPDLKEELNKLPETTKSKDSGKCSKKPKQSFVPKNSDTDSHVKSSPNFIYIISLLVIMIAGLFGFFLYGVPKKPSDKISVTELVANLKNHFKGQQPHTFKVLKQALTRVVNDSSEPQAPAIFTIVVNKGAEKTASDFSVHLAEALAPSKFVSIKEPVQRRYDPADLKFKIDNDIKSKLEPEILNVVIVDRLNDIPIDAAIIFHGFCDHESAPYKRAVYLFIVHLGRSIPENSTIKDIDAVAMESLKGIWHTSSNDLVDSLITRITVNVVNIR